MNRNLFIIATPLHVYTTAEIVYQGEQDSYNCFLITSTGAKACSSLLEKIGRFCSGYKIIDASWCSPNGATSIIPKKFTKALIKARLLPEAKNILDDVARDDFNKIFIFSPNALTAYMRYTHQNSRFILGEDGTGTYSGAIGRRVFSFDTNVNNDSCSVSGRFMSFVNKVFFDGKLLYKTSDLYVHCPEMLEYSFEGVVHRIEPGEKYRKLLESLSLIDSRKKVYSQYDCIFLGQPMGELCSKTKIFSILNVITNSDLEWIYRPHPRENDIFDGLPLESDPGSWELRSMTEITDDTLLVSICSTAMGIPKMLFGKEPSLVFLHHLVWDNSVDIFKSTDNFVKSLQTTYSMPKRIHVPEKIDEFAELLTGMNQ